MEIDRDRDKKRKRKSVGEILIRVPVPRNKLTISSHFIPPTHTYYLLYISLVKLGQLKLLSNETRERNSICS